LPYTPQTWSDSPSTSTPLSAARLTVMETGIEDADTRITAIETPSRNAQTGTTYTVVAGDAGKVVEMNNASSNTITFPSLAAGTVITILQYGAGTTSVAVSGVTRRSRGGLSNLAGQYAMASVFYRTTTELILSGDLA
jgi:hypothetical protein